MRKTFRKTLLLLTLCATAAAGQQDLCDFTAEADAADIDGLELLMGDPADSCEGYSVSFANFRATVAANLTTTGVLTIPAGTAAAPSITVGDTNTGAFAPAEGLLAFATNGVSRLNVGSDVYHSQGLAGWTATTATATAPSMVPSITDTNTGIGSNTSDQLSLIAGGVEGARVTAGVTTLAAVLRLTAQATAPATCTAYSDLYADTSGALCWCSATNTWTVLTGGGSCV